LIGFEQCGRLQLCSVGPLNDATTVLVYGKFIVLFQVAHVK